MTPSEQALERARANEAAAQKNREAMPQCAAFADDIRQAFGGSNQEVSFGWRVVYAEEGGIVRGTRGDEGVVPNL